MRSGSESTGPLRERAKGFWQSHSEAGEDAAGYLTSEWPMALAAERLRGEWAWVENTLRRYEIPRGNCLDAGCGPGHWLCRLATVFAHAEGFDGAAGMVRTAGHRIVAHSLQNATVSQADISEFDSPRRFDLIFVGGVLTYLEEEEAQRTVKKLASLLSPNGWLLFRETTYRGDTFRRTAPLKPGLFADPSLERPPYFALYRSLLDMRGLFEASGLTIVKQELNHAYKLSDFAEGMLRVINRMSGDTLKSDAERAERWAQRLYRYRHLGLNPAYHVLRVLPFPLWRVQNHWFLCRV